MNPYRMRPSLLPANQVGKTMTLDLSGFKGQITDTGEALLAVCNGGAAAQGQDKAGMPEYCVN